jgi:hypothetical protein
LFSAAEYPPNLGYAYVVNLPFCSSHTSGID